MVLMKIRLRNGFPQVVRKIALQYFIYQVHRPDNVMNDEVQKRMVVMPADEQGVYTQQEIDDTAVSVIHGVYFTMLA